MKLARRLSVVEPSPTLAVSAKAAKLKDYDSAMPAFAGVLSDAEIVAVLSWIKSQWPPETRRRQEEMNDAARRQL